MTFPTSRSRAYDVVVNKPKVAPYRAPGGPPAGFAGETLIDELSEKLSIDPIEFRLLNGAKEGTRRVTGLVLPPYRLLGNAAGGQEPPSLSVPTRRP